jgi:FixJ family two-component response regulator
MSITCCIAIVDDDESIRDAAVRLFRSMAFEAVAFASAEEFLQSNAVATASCLVLDVHMPGMGGLTLQRYLAASGSHIPIVFVTGELDESVRETALESGAVCILSKPFQERDLLNGLESALIAR